jgi:hypothetical protein
LRRRVTDSVARAELGQRVAVTADRVADRVQHAAADARGSLAAFEPPVHRQRSRRRGGAVAALLLLGAVLAVGFAWWRRRHRDEEYARLARTPDEPLAGPAAPSSPDGLAATPTEADSAPMAQPATAPAPAWTSAEREPQSAPAAPWNRAAARPEARFASRSLFDSSTELPRFDAIKPPAPRFDPPGPSYGKFAP